MRGRGRGRSFAAVPAVTPGPAAGDTVHRPAVMHAPQDTRREASMVMNAASPHVVSAAASHFSVQQLTTIRRPPAFYTQLWLLNRLVAARTLEVKRRMVNMTPAQTATPAAAGI